MKSALRSEWRKLLSVRSTFVMGAVVLIITAAVAFFAYGYKSSPADLANPNFLHDGILGLLNVVGLFSSLVAVLLVTHEYRYNTIMHTLTATKHRLAIIASKAAVTTVYSVTMTLAVSILTVGFAILGARLRGEQLSQQSLALGELLARGLFFVWAYTMLGLLLAFIIRNQVATIVTLLVVPTAGEGLLSLLLHSNIKYLPFQALGSLLTSPDSSGGAALSAMNSAGVVMVYIIAGAIAAAVLLQRRDAN